jgi:6-phosphogluconolactonase
MDMYVKRVMSSLCAASALLSASPAVFAAQVESVYTMSNQVAGNEVLVFHRRPNGNLEAAGAFATGGNGTGGGLGNQGAVVLDSSDHWLFAVNAGSSSIASLQVLEAGLQLVDTESSGGFRPISLTVFGTRLFVLNAGDPSDENVNDNITGFQINQDGTLTPIPNSTQPLSANETGPAQISFNKEGTVLLVTEKATNSITTYTVDPDGIPSSPLTRASAMPTPFGFQFGDRDLVYISEANGGGQSAVVSYHVNPETGVVSNAVDVFSAQNAACWVALANDQTVGYTTNTASDTISLFTINFDGSMDALLASGKAVQAGDAPIDLVLTQDGRNLYTLNAADDTISAFHIQPNGSLSRLRTISVPDGTNGLAAR